MCDLTSHRHLQRPPPWAAGPFPWLVASDPFLDDQLVLSARRCLSRCAPYILPLLGRRGGNQNQPPVDRRPIAMAVEARHPLHTGGQKKPPATCHAGWEGRGGGDLCCGAPTTGRRAGYYGTDAAAVGRRWSQTLLQGYGHRQPSSGQVMTTTVGQYGQVVCAAESSGVTFGGAQEVAVVAPTGKRKRADQASQFLGLGGAAQLLQRQLVDDDVDRLVVQHTAKMQAQLTEQRRHHARQVVASAEAVAAKRLRAKDEEIARMAGLNWALEERVRSLILESQLWRDLAQSNEAAANALRRELQLALDAQRPRHGFATTAAAADDDAASRCCGENDVVDAGKEEQEEVGTTTTSRSERRCACAVCGGGAAEVLLLPCRHLCACAPCAVEARACPECGCAKNGSVCVNFS